MSTARRDKLIEIQDAIQGSWKRSKCFEATPSEAKKFFCTFPYPYMNGRQHLGHAFSLSKAEFAARYHRLHGDNVLWPFAFHCTGMPIKACADKLKREASEGPKRTDVPPPEAPREEAGGEGGGAAKFVRKKGKAAAKKAGQATQSEVMKSIGIPDDEIPNFADAMHWVKYFPPHAIRDLERLGVAVDWRRSFVTTDVNPYYDAFIRWQFNVLKASGKIQFGSRVAVFAPLENQACADHDRAQGEGVVPQTYTGIKMRLMDPPEGLPDLPVFLVAATLRPETMVGQTNCFVLPTGEYCVVYAFGASKFGKPLPGGVEAYEANLEDTKNKSGELYIISQTAARNMGYQGLLPLSPVDRKAHVLKTLKGSDLIGRKVRSPRCTYEAIYVLPMATIKMDKGTGVVTSVPSDAPDDWIVVEELMEDEKLREKHGVQMEWLKAPVEIIEVPEYGKLSAPTVCKQMGIKTSKDKALLAEAKDKVYLKGFNEGVMLTGPCTSRPVSEAKVFERDAMLESREAISYSEPDGRVVSRSGEDCVAAMCDQWYLDYGNSDWKDVVYKHASDMDFYNPACKHHQMFAIGWLREWACSRTYGLGSKIPWDVSMLIESLSDSTIYMAFYTIAHYLQEDMYGSRPGLAGAPPSSFSDAVFDYVFHRTDDPPSTDIPTDVLTDMRNEFGYWYPLDLRVSGKDLIPNHLAFCMFNHEAVWEGQKLGPKSFFCNGHLMINGAKMSKQEGNFITLSDALDKYGADAVRIALAHSGDGLDDANFTEDTANSAIHRLTILTAFVESVCTGEEQLRTGPILEMDEFLQQELYFLIAETDGHFKRMMFRDGLISGFYDFGTAKDFYKQLCGSQLMHKDCVELYIETQLRVLHPIAPHTCEHLLQRYRGTSEIVLAWPMVPLADTKLLRKLDVLRESASTFRKTKEKSKKKGDTMIIYVATEYAPWQSKILSYLRDALKEGMPDGSRLTLAMGDLGFEGKEIQKAMAFAQFQLKEVVRIGVQALEDKTPFEEIPLYETYRDHLSTSVKVKDLVIHKSTDRHASDESDKASSANPSRPTCVFI